MQAKTTTNESERPTRPGTELRIEALVEIEHCVCRDRQNSYGDAEDNFRDIARMWAIYLEGRKGESIAAVDVAAMMSLMKIARIKTSPAHLDN